MTSADLLSYSVVFKGAGASLTEMSSYEIFEVGSSYIFQIFCSSFTIVTSTYSSYLSNSY